MGQFALGALGLLAIKLAFAAAKAAHAAGAHGDIGAAVALLHPALHAFDGSIYAAGFAAGDRAAHKHLITLPLLKRRAGKDGPHIPAGVGTQNLILCGCISKHRVALQVGDHQCTVALLILGKLQVHGDLFAVAFGPVHGRAKGHHGAAVDIAAHIAVKAGIGGGVGAGHHRAAVDHQPAVGVDAVALFAKAGNDVQAAAVDGGDRHAVLVGVDAVVAAADVDGTAVDGQVQLGVKAFVISGQVKAARAVHIHGHIGVDGAVLFPQLFFALGILVNAGHMAALDQIAAAFGKNQVCPRSSGVHRALGGFGAPVVIALVHVQKQNGRGNGTGDVGPVQDQGDHCSGVFGGLFAQIHPDLPLGQGSGQLIPARGGDVDHRVGGRFVGGMALGRSALAVRVAACIAVAVFIIDDVITQVHRRRGGAGRLAVYRNAVGRKGNLYRLGIPLARRCCRRGSRRSRRAAGSACSAAAGQKRRRQQQDGQFLMQGVLLFHVGTPP